MDESDYYRNMKRKGLKTKLQFEFNIEEEVPDLNYDVSFIEKKTNKINIHKKKKIRKDASININLF